MMIGFSFHHSMDAFTHATAVETCVQAFLSPTWCKPLRFLTLQTERGKPLPRRSGVIRQDERAARLADLLVHPDVWCVSLRSSGEGLHAELNVDTRENWVSGSYLLSCGRQSIDGHTNAWVSAMLGLVEPTSVGHGIVTVMSASGTLSEISFVGMTIDGIKQHPLPDEFERMRGVLGELGTRYVRFPRWGTIYAKEHVAQLGGAERIRGIVRPALVRELGDAFYFQLTDSVATATSAETMQKQHAFTELAAPLLPPAITAR